MTARPLIGAKVYDTDDVPVVVIGDGPVGFVCAVHLASRYVAFIVVEVGDCPASSVRSWRHVDMFSRWSMDFDPATESPRGLAILADPNTRSCLYVPPHGVQEFTLSEAGFYLLGMESYGRAPSFLLQTGYGQVRSVVAAITTTLAGGNADELVGAMG